MVKSPKASVRILYSSVALRSVSMDCARYSATEGARHTIRHYMSFDRRPEPANDHCRVIDSGSCTCRVPKSTRGNVCMKELFGDASQDAEAEHFGRVTNIEDRSGHDELSNGTPTDLTCM